MWGTFGDTSQNGIQLLLLLLAGISIPLMLLPKPLILMRKKKCYLDSSSDEIECNATFIQS